MLVLLLACAPEHPTRAEIERTTDTGEPIETGDTAPIDTAPVDTAALRADVTYGGVPSTVECGGGASLMTHTFVDAMGNVAGEVSCVSGAGDTLRITFTSGMVGSWTEPGTADWSWTSATGDVLAWGAAGTVNTAWSLSFSTFTRTTTKSIDFEAAFSGAWNDDAAVELGTVDGTVAATLTCDGCP